MRALKKTVDGPYAPQCADAGASDFQSFVEAEAEAEWGRTELLKAIVIECVMLLLLWLFFSANTSTTTLQGLVEQSQGANAAAAIGIVLNMIMLIITIQKAQIWYALKEGAESGNGVFSKIGAVRYLNFLHAQRMFSVVVLLFNTYTTVALGIQVNQNTGASGTLSILFQIFKSIFQLYMCSTTTSKLYLLAKEHKVYNVPVVDDIPQLSSLWYYVAFLEVIETLGANATDLVFDIQDEEQNKGAASTAQSAQDGAAVTSAAHVDVSMHHVATSDTHTQSLSNHQHTQSPPPPYVAHQPVAAVDTMTAHARVLYAWAAQDDTQLSVAEGDSVLVDPAIDASSGWLFCKNPATGKQGYIPTTYAQVGAAAAEAVPAVPEAPLPPTLPVVGGADPAAQQSQLYQPMGDEQ